VMPNTRVLFLSALFGGVLGGSLWQLAHIIFAWFQGMGTYYNAVYGALYHLLFLVIWMFWSWLVVLFGNEVAYAHQNLARLRHTLARPTPGREPVDEYLALTALAAIGDRFMRRRPPLTTEDFSRMFSQDNFLAERLTQVLKECGVVLETAPHKPGDAPGLIPALPLDQITVRQVLDCFRTARGAALVDSLSGQPRIEALLKRVAERTSPSPWDSLSLAEFIALAGPEAASDPAAIGEK
jgi:membrane protein